MKQQTEMKSIDTWTAKTAAATENLSLIYAWRKMHGDRYQKLIKYRLGNATKGCKQREAYAVLRVLISFTSIRR